MITFKQIEYWLNIILILAFVIALLLKQQGQLLIIAYMVVGTVQVAGMLVHKLNNWFLGAGSIRSRYHWVVVVLLLLIPTGISMWLLLFTAPCFAVFYVWLCLRELRALALKTFVHLK